jgi:hypothetical protein
MTTTQGIGPQGLNANTTPFAFQHYAKDFYSAYCQCKSDAAFSPARLFLVCRSIELAAKALHFSTGQSTDQVKKLNHDLFAACDETVLANSHVVLSQAEKENLEKANKYYKDKGFEYFLFKYPNVPVDHSGPQLAAQGWPDRPDETILASVVEKLIAVKL